VRVASTKVHIDFQTKPLYLVLQVQREEKEGVNQAEREVKKWDRAESRDKPT
jgi:hypothetical protein